MILLTVSVKAQVTNISHLGSISDWCGWNSFTFSPLSIVHAGHYPINFYTDSLQRVTIMPTTGNMGIDIAKPQSLLHINDAIGGSMLQMTNIATGNGSPDVGFKIGLTSTTAKINQQENADLLFYTGSVNGGLNSTRMDITGGPFPTQGYIAIGPNFTTPKSLLHLNDTDFVYTQWTNRSTGSNVTDGFKIGL